MLGYTSIGLERERMLATFIVIRAIHQSILYSSGRDGKRQRFDLDSQIDIEINKDNFVKIISRKEVDYNEIKSM